MSIVLRLMLSAAISGAIHYYVWNRLTKRTELDVRWRRIVAIAMVLLWISIPLTTVKPNDARPRHRSRATLRP